MATPLFAPLSALQRERQRAQKLSRGIVPLASPVGVFSVRALSLEPMGIHPLELEIESADEGAALEAWFDGQLGACKPFWVPSYQLDLPITLPIGAADDSFVIPFIGYTRWLFPSQNRRTLAFMRVDGSFMVRRVLSAIEDVPTLTETLTINEPLGEDFAPSNATGICFLWYGRLQDDVLEIAWDTQETGSATLQMVELHDPPVVESCDLGPVDGIVLDDETET